MKPEKKKEKKQEGMDYDQYVDDWLDKVNGQKEIRI